jgi:hypothetical protein
VVAPAGVVRCSRSPGRPSRQMQMAWWMFDVWWVWWVAMREREQCRRDLYTLRRGVARTTRLPAARGGRRHMGKVPISPARRTVMSARMRWARRLCGAATGDRLGTRRARRRRAPVHRCSRAAAVPSVPLHHRRAATGKLPPPASMCFSCRRLAAGALETFPSALSQR